jgi:FkbM family methyltransferase
MKIITSFVDHYGAFGYRGLWLAIRTKLFRKQRLEKFTLSGTSNPIWLRMGTSDWPTYKQIFVASEYDIPLNREVKFIIDAGANIGLSAIFFARKYKQATILAIEPEPSNFELLKRNTAPYPNIIPINSALWSHDTSLDLIDPGTGFWGFQAASPESTNKGKRLGRISGITVKSLMELHKTDQVDILKIDIEGGEIEIFENAEQWIKNVSVIIAELHDKFRVGCARAFYRATGDFEHEVHRGEHVFMFKN